MVYHAHVGWQSLSAASRCVGLAGRLPAGGSAQSTLEYPIVRFAYP